MGDAGWGGFRDSGSANSALPLSARASMPRSVPSHVLALGSNMLVPALEECPVWKGKHMCDTSWTMSQLPPSHRGQEACISRTSRPEVSLIASFSCLQARGEEGLPKATQCTGQRWLSLQRRQRAKPPAVARTVCGHGEDCISLWELGRTA